jgi:hypothetical protein
VGGAVLTSSAASGTGALQSVGECAPPPKNLPQNTVSTVLDAYFGQYRGNVPGGMSAGQGDLFQASSCFERTDTIGLDKSSTLDTSTPLTFFQQ